MAEGAEIVVGLDIGTTKIAAVVGEVTESGLNILGVGTYPSKGLRKGVVVNIDDTVRSIQAAIEEAENMSMCEIKEVYAGIAGGHIDSFPSQGMVPIRDGRVTEQDVRRVLEGAQAVKLPFDREIIHVIPQEYVVDGQDGIREPVGMNGVRLEARVHLVTAAVTSAENIVQCCHQCGLDVADIVLEPLASAMAVLEEDEKELGVALVDIGGGTTDLAVYVEGAVVHTSVLTIGGDHLTKDLAVGLRTPTAEAARLKEEFGAAMAELVGEDEVVLVPSTGGRPPREESRRFLATILEMRMEEIFHLVQHTLEDSGYLDLLGAGLVVTGGTAALPGIDKLAERVLEMPVRIGVPREVLGLSSIVAKPKFATGVGLVKYGAEMGRDPYFRAQYDEENLYRRMWRRMRDWWREVF